MIATNYSDWVKQLKKLAHDSHHRVALVMSGEQSWGQQQAGKIIATLETSSVLWVSNEIEAALPATKARSQLGSEYDAIVFDAYQEFDADAFGAISGTLRGGGVFIVLIPTEGNWVRGKESRFRQRALALFKHHQASYFLQQGEPFPVIPTENIRVTQQQEWFEPFLTMEQQQVVETIINNASSKNPAPIVITSDRGRGKSSALGLAAGFLLEQDINNIIVTAPRLTTSEPVFRHARQVLPAAEDERGKLVYNDNQLKFMAPDALLKQQPEADLLLVDEAAAIPLPMLEKLLHHYPRIVFSSTIHGYEGTGRGFVLKFNKILDAFHPGWQQLTMHTPVRWAENDPVEQWIDRILCLDAELPEVPIIENILIENCHINEIDRDTLINDEQQLSCLAGVCALSYPAF
ncbi:MAG: DUF1726 domain-containing protein [Gammaproteobacteria bacterium]